MAGDLLDQMRCDPGLFLDFAQGAGPRLLALVDPALRHLPRLVGIIDPPTDPDEAIKVKQHHADSAAV